MEAVVGVVLFLKIMLNLPETLTEIHKQQSYLKQAVEVAMEIVHQLNLKFRKVVEGAMVIALPQSKIP